MKLGRLPERHDPRTLRLARYLPVDLPRPPDVVDYAEKVDRYPMAFNDVEGCCAVTSLYHLHLTACANTGRQPRMAESDVDKTYRLLSGYDGTPDTDTGLVMLDVLKYAKRAGWIAGFVRVNEQRLDHVRHALWMFGGIYVGADLPRSAFPQLDAGDLWSVEDPTLVGNSKPGGLGGHAFGTVSLEPKWLRAATWARKVRVTWAWWRDYVSECWAVLSPDWIEEATQKAPPGFALDELRADLSALGAA